MWRKSVGWCEVIGMPTRKIMCLQIRNKDNAVALFNKKFCWNEMLNISDSTWCDSKSLTFDSEAHQTVSWIDHCIRNSNLHSAITDTSILYNYASSDHLPLYVAFDLAKTMIHSNSEETPDGNAKINWQKLNKDYLAQYKALTEQSLATIKLNQSFAVQWLWMLWPNPYICHWCYIQQCHLCLGDCWQCVYAENAYADMLPFLDGRSFVKMLKWSGWPRSGVIFQTMLQTRAAFKQALRHCRRSDSRCYADNLAWKLLTKDSSKF